MRECINGTFYDMGPEKEAEFLAWQAGQSCSQPQNLAPPTDAERLAALENQLAGIVSAYREGVNEA